eukprot:140678-Chlamydomonas_euryale.AAC.1
MCAKARVLTSPSERAVSIIGGATPTRKFAGGVSAGCCSRTIHVCASARLNSRMPTTVAWPPATAPSGPGRRLAAAPSAASAAARLQRAGFQRRLRARSMKMLLECSVMESMMLSRLT